MGKQRYWSLLQLQKGKDGYKYAKRVRNKYRAYVKEKRGEYCSSKRKHTERNNKEKIKESQGSVAKNKNTMQQQQARGTQRSTPTGLTRTTGRTRRSSGKQKGDKKYNTANTC